MGVINKIVFSALTIIYFLNGITSDDQCGDWEAYKDEKCLKIFETASLLDYTDAENYCKEEQNGSYLLSIDVPEKQKFIETVLKSHSVVDYVWTGLKYTTNNEYQWSDGTELYYTNWASGSPKNDTTQCVQIETDDEEFGKWSEVLCSKKNLVICEKIQPWSLDHMQTILMNVMKDRVPVGLIYVQLPKEKSPAEIWPSMEWDDITSDYAGMFFRAAGGNAAGFGEVQEEDSPRLTTIQGISTTSNNHLVNVSANGEFSDIIAIHGSNNNQHNWNLQVMVSKAEVRPFNMAVKIWKKIK